MRDFASQDALERRHDGPILPDDPAAARFCPLARARLHERLAGEARGAIGLRRVTLAAREVLADARLAELARTLRCYRDDGRRWLGRDQDGR